MACDLPENRFLDDFLLSYAPVTSEVCLRQDKWLLFDFICRLSLNFILGALPSFYLPSVIQTYCLNDQFEWYSFFG